MSARSPRGEVDSSLLAALAFGVLLSLGAVLISAIAAAVVAWGAL